MKIPRYVTGALLFGLIWAVIAYTQHGVTDPKRLAGGVLTFFVLGTALSWVLTRVLTWFRNRR